MQWRSPKSTGSCVGVQTHVTAFLQVSRKCHYDLSNPFELYDSQDKKTINFTSGLQRHRGIFSRQRLEHQICTKETKSGVPKITSKTLLSKLCFSGRHKIFIDKLNMLFYQRACGLLSIHTGFGFCFGVVSCLKPCGWRQSEEDKPTAVLFHHFSNKCMCRRERLLIIILGLVSALFFKYSNSPTSSVFPVLLNKRRICFIKYLAQRSLISSL